MAQSETITAIATALSVAQGQMKAAIKDNENPHFRSKYADLASCWDACRAPLAGNGLAVVQLTEADGAKVTVTTTLMHKSGEWISAALALTAKDNTPQGIGSTITYARRYGLSSMVGIAPEEDDGNAGSGAAQRSKPNAAASPNAVAARRMEEEAAKVVPIQGEKLLAAYLNRAVDKPSTSNVLDELSAAMDLAFGEQQASQRYDDIIVEFGEPDTKAKARKVIEAMYMAVANHNAMLQTR